MSLQQLVEGDCGGVNPLMQLGGRFTRDAAHKDDGFTRAQFERSTRKDDQMVNDFLGQVAGPPKSFQMETLLQEMREIDLGNNSAVPLHAGPRIIDEVSGQWSTEFGLNQHQVATASPLQMLHAQPQQQQMTYAREFFDTAPNVATFLQPGKNYLPPPTSCFAVYPHYQPNQIMASQTSPLTDKFFEDTVIVEKEMSKPLEDWVTDFQTVNEENEQAASNYNEQFWQRLQNEWQKLSEESEHPWLTEFNESYDPYKEYQFAEDNPMSKVENALERGKEYLAKGDIPSAVLCFEAAAAKEPENAESWELLGLSQAENEMDPHSIAALKRSLALKPENQRVLMALAVCYTNESLQSHALKMLTNWLQVHPKYKQLVEQQPTFGADGASIASEAASSLIIGSRLQEIQNLYLNAVRLNPHQVDPDVQEALGVLYNLSSEFDKAVDCFHAALAVNPQNAKVWNRLGASLANGSRSVEAVEAYQKALQLEPGFIRVRYNVGVCCMNLKAYRQAAEHLLTALNMQANSVALRELNAGVVVSGQQQMSESIWNTLKMVISLMGRSDLQNVVSERNLEALNEAFKE